MSRSADAWRIGIDVGGTFTDLVLAGADGEVRVFKVPSVPDDPAKGVMDALASAAAALDTDVSGLLPRCGLLVHGSTIATNTLVERTGARVGIITTKGFRDSIEVRRGRRDNPWNHREPNPEVLVPRYLRRPVRGRLDARGAELEALSREDVEAAAHVFAEESVESVAICLINAYVNPAHERAAAEVLRATWGGRWISVSTDIVPSLGEYERGTTAAMNAYIAPKTVGYLRELNDRLAVLGLAHPILLIQNNGGAVSVEQVAERPVTLLLSGPAAGVGALGFYRPAIGADDLISMEIGGTSCDVILMNRGQVAVVDDFQIAGYHLLVPSADVHTVGAGGGTIAGVDGAGLLYVGPRGAGARPGPAAYGLGGTEPTVTDAQIVLGRLRGGSYAAGSLTLDESLACAAIDEKVARPLGIDIEQAAAGIVQLVEQHILHAVQRISIERGHDPRRFVLVAGGGAGPMHAAGMGRLLGCPRVYVPRLSGAFCALGMLHSDVRHDFVRAHVARLAALDATALEGAWREIEAEAVRFLEAEGFAAGERRLEREIDLRYVGQQWDVRVRLAPTEDLATVRKRFEEEHERLFGHHQPGGLIETTKLRVVGIGRIPPWRPAAPTPAAAPPEPVARRRVYVDADHGWVQAAVYTGCDLRPGHRVRGPAIVEEATTTVVTGPRDTLEVDVAGNYLITLAE